MYSVVYYSATGNTKYLAYRLKDALGADDTKVMDILEVRPDQLETDEQLIIMYPIHAFNAPKEIIDYVSRIPEQHFEKVTLIGVGCNEMWLNDANAVKLKHVLAGRGYTVERDYVIAMPLTMVVKVQQAQGQALIQAAEQKIQQVAMEITQDVTTKRVIPRRARLLAHIGKVEKQAATLFGRELHAKATCVGCGLCAKQCAAQNIVMNNAKNKPTFKGKCSMCMKCIYACPKGAIQPRVSRFLPLKEGYCVENYLK